MRHDPTRAQVVSYLERYAAHFGITPRFNVRLERARPAGASGWDVRTSDGESRARHLHYDGWQA